MRQMRIKAALRFVFGLSIIACTPKTFDMSHRIPIKGSFEDAREIFIQAHKSRLFDTLKIVFPNLAEQKGNFVQFSYGQDDSVNHPDLGYIDILVTCEHKDADLPGIMKFVEARMKVRILDFENQNGR
jgi:hypothetical protein